MSNENILNDEQKTAIISFKKENEIFLKKINELEKFYKKNIEPLTLESDNFWEIATQLEKSNSQYPLGMYANYYFRNFEEPSEPFLNEWDQKNPAYTQITKEQKIFIEEQIPDKNNFNNLLQKFIDNLSSLLSEIIPKNFIITRLIGLQEKYAELKQCEKHWWFPRELASDKYYPKSVITSEIHLPITLPYHRALMIEYYTLFNTSSLLKNKLESMKQILDSINEFLPFAKLIPESQIAEQIINVTADSSDKSITLGNENAFKNDTLIGHGVEIEKR